MQTEHIEVERRARGTFLPPGAEPLYTAHIFDVYTVAQPFLMERIRWARVSYFQLVKSRREVTRKTLIHGEYVESELDEKPTAYIARLLKKGGCPRVIVAGRRHAYNVHGLTVCNDRIIRATMKGIEDLGAWTEMERLVHSADEIPDARQEVYDGFLRVGVARDRLVIEPYPVLNLKANGRVAGRLVSTSTSSQEDALAAPRLKQ